MKKSIKILLFVGMSLFIAATIGLTVALVVVQNDRAEAESRLNGLYEKSYYDVLDYLADVKLKTDKATVLQGRSLPTALLSDVWRESELAATVFSQMGTESEESDKVVKFLNQLSDYARSLTIKLRQESLSAEEKGTLKRYADLVQEIESALRSVQEKLVRGEDIDASGLSDFSLISDVVKTYSSVDYPEMIYDGPFSDGLKDRETKYLTGKEELSLEALQEKVLSYFPAAENVTYVGESATTIPAYLFSFRLGRNEGTLALTKVGGYVLSYNAYCLVEDPVLTEEECVEKGNEYIEKMGYQNMKAVWVNNDDSTVYINYAYCEGDVVVYPDLVKIKVCSETGDLIGVESQNYLYNHTERDLLINRSVSLDIDESLSVVSQTYCVIPTETNEEIASKEIVATREGVTYYLYYDLSDGEEVRCLVVIEDEGRVLQ